MNRDPTPRPFHDQLSDDCHRQVAKYLLREQVAHELSAHEKEAP
jgi:hypothetical protein